MKFVKDLYSPKELINLRKIIEKKLQEKKSPFYKKIFRFFFKK